MNKSLVKTLFASVAAISLMVSCGEERDLQKLWESKVVDSEFNEYFTETFGEVASDQDFHMVSQRTMNIANIGGDINTEYTVYVCQGNPHYEGDAMALYQTTAQGQSALSITFDMPIGLDHVWIVRSAPEDQVASYVTVSQTVKEINVSLESEETKAQVNEATVNEVTNNLFDFSYVHSNIDGHIYTMSAPSTALENKYYEPATRVGYEFRADAGTYNQLNLNNYSIQGYSDRATSPACTIYIAGDVTIEASCNFYYIDFYIPSGSTLTYNGSTIEGGVQFHVKKGGKLILNVENLNGANSSWPSGIVNEGEVIINGATKTTEHDETTITSCTVTFPLDDAYAVPATWTAYTAASSSSADFTSAYVNLTQNTNLSKIEKATTVTELSDNFVGFKATEKVSTSFANNSSHFDNSIELALNFSGASFKPTNVTANVARGGTDNGKLDLYMSRGTWDTPTALATGLVPQRYNRTLEKDTLRNNPNFCGTSISYDVPESVTAGDWISLYLYPYELGAGKEMYFNNVVISGILTKTTKVVDGTYNKFYMSNYCNFYNAGTMTINCDMEFNPADGNEICDFFTNYDGATLTAQTITIGGEGAKFGNAGTMNLSGDLILQTGAGGGAQTVNIGTLTAANLDLHAGVSHFYNGGSTVISGLTQSTQAGNTWVNNGYYKTEDLMINASNSTFYNYCQLIVTDEFYLHDAAFNNMPSSYAQAKYMNAGNFAAYLYDNSVLYITDLLHIDQGKGAGGDNQFQGQGTEYALVAARQMDVLTSSSKNIQFLGNVEYAWKTFRYLDADGNELTEAQANEKAGDGEKIIFYADETAKNVYYDELTIKTPDPEDCGSTEWNPGGGPTPSAFTYTLAYEDLGSKDDFDFNDIVLRVTHTGGTNVGTVQLVAAGGTLKISIAYDGETLFSHNDGVMYGTGGAESSYAISQMPGVKEATITMSDDFSWADDDCLNMFTLNVRNDGGEFEKAISATTQAGYAPQCLVIPNGTWQWPTGRTSIRDAYPDFSAWVANKKVNTSWYNNPASGKVYTGQ